MPVVECEYLARCGWIVSVEHCLLLREQRTDLAGEAPYQRLVDPRMVDAVAAGTVLYSPESAGACIDAIQARSCNGMVADSAREVCDRALVGTVPDGGIPSYPFECVSGAQSFYCDAFTCCSEPCVAAYLQRGEECLEYASSCAPGLACRGGACADPVAKGERCESTSGCVAGLECNGGRCVPPPEDADECVEFGSLGGTVNYFCPHIGRACGPDRRCLPLRGPGDACSLEANYCGGGTVCDFDEGTCMEPSPEGGPCFEGGNWPLCQAGLYCQVDDESRTCRPLVADGGPCPYDSPYGCASGFCDRDSDICGPRPTCP
jgi:hypothetical protein